MKIYIKNHNYHYEIENLTRIFFPNDKLEVTREQTELLEIPYIYTELSQGESENKVSVSVCIDGETASAEKLVSGNEDAELTMALALFEILKGITNINPPWGVLTGVRPIKLFRRLAKDGGLNSAKETFLNNFKVSQEKTDLSVETEQNESKIIALSRPESFSLYISVPFCPSRCSYCSFVSASVERTKHLVQPYVDLLCREIELTAGYAKKLGLRLESVYMGGGTPTTLNAQQLDRVLNTVKASFDMTHCREFTVEAGRPDTITRDKLAAIIGCGVDRISINPQTLNDEILKIIGRRHTAEQTLDAFTLARKLGFNHINMDLIAGLPNESYNSFVATLDKITELDPESVTIHTLSMKRSSNLTQSGKELYADEAAATAKMLSYANKKLHDNGYFPYYLYRQSRMVGNLENTGWSKRGKEGIYNVFVMDETHTILACGAGAVSKLKDSKKDYLERIFNFKYPYEYIGRFDELVKRKERIESFYAEYH
ncbi:MAG: coproporphyrinogen dehydrogenase HemZ [Lachnospiraceae bacterium]|nr:coproporphyrinogen dehydrogenase HemZ [Lachnospiraceae bacterium]